MSAMNYNKLYTRFIESKQSRPLVKEQGYEFHHILPKSLGGSNRKDNLVKLTHKEHLKAHEYLVKMYDGEAKTKMEIALGSMKSDRTIQRTASLKLWKNKDYKQRQIEVHKSYAQNNREQYANEMARRWQDPEFRAKILASRRRVYDNPEWSKKCRERNQKMWNDPAMRKKITSARWG